jgi:hypothetical protein
MISGIVTKENSDGRKNRRPSRRIAKSLPHLLDLRRYIRIASKTLFLEVIPPKMSAHGRLALTN